MGAILHRHTTGDVPETSSMIRITLKSYGDAFRVRFFTEWLDSNHNEWLESESKSYLQNLQTSDWKKQVPLHSRNWAVIASLNINIGANFLFSLCLLVVLWYILSINCSTKHGCRASTLLFTEGPAVHSTHLSRFNVVFPHQDHGSQPHAFNFSFFLKMNGFMFFKSNSNPTITFQNPMQTSKENLV